MNEPKPRPPPPHTYTVATEAPRPPAAAQPRLFEPFRRGEAALPSTGRSVGLGLYITRAILEAHGGTIEVRSTAGEGTSFIASVPLTPP